MSRSQETVFTDQQVGSKVLDIIQEAQKSVVIVTPYIKLWGHAKRALSLAVKRGINITAILRSNGDKQNDDLIWLGGNGVKVLTADSLHAKIYLNEHTIFVTSMNLLESSMKNSLEIGIIVSDEQARKAIRDFVNNTLMRLAIPVTKSGISRRSADVDILSNLDKGDGYCIRCHREITFNVEKPLCLKCYRSWEEYSDLHYTEKCCHSCGRSFPTSLAKPLCNDCFRN